MRRIGKCLAVLLSFFVLATNLAVVSADSVPAGTELIVNGGFENGTEGWGVAEEFVGLSQDDPHNGKNCMKFESQAHNGTTFGQSVAVKTNTNYCFSIFYKASAEWAVLFKAEDNGEVFVNEPCSDSGNLWKEYTCTFNSGSHTNVYVWVMGNIYGGNPVYVDDISLKEVPPEPKPEAGVIINGDFENGSQGWNLSGVFSVTDEASRSPSHSLKLAGTGSYSGCSQLIPLKTNTDYIITFYAKMTDTSNGSAVVKLFKGNTDDNNFKFLGDTFLSQTNSDFEFHRLEFNSGTYDVCNLLIMDNNATGYFDDFTITKKKPGIENGDFSNGSDGWVLGGLAQIYNEAGNNYIQVNRSDAFNFGFKQEVRVNVAMDYTLTFRYKLDTTGVNNGDIHVRVYRGPEENNDYEGLVLNETKTDWTEAKIDFNSGNNSTVQVTVWANGAVGAFDDFVLTSPVNINAEYDASSFIPGEVVIYRVELENTTGNPRSISIITAYYDSSMNKVIGCQVSTFELDSYQKRTEEITLTTPAGANHMKTFIWSTLADVQPICGFKELFAN